MIIWREKNKFDSWIYGVYSFFTKSVGWKVSRKKCY